MHPAGGGIGAHPGCGAHGFCIIGIEMVGSDHGGEGSHPIGIIGMHPIGLHCICAAHSGRGGGQLGRGASVGRGAGSGGGALDPSLIGGINPNETKKKSFFFFLHLYWKLMFVFIRRKQKET